MGQKGLICLRDVVYTLNVAMLCKKTDLTPSGVVYVFVFILFSALSCSTMDKKEPSLVTMNDGTITENDFVASLAADEREKYLAFKREHLNRMILKRLIDDEAKRRNQTFEQLLQEEVFSKAGVSHDEIHVYYEKNKKDYRNKKHPLWEKEIGILLRNQKSSLFLRAFVDRLRTNSNVHYFLPELAFNKDTKEGRGAQ